MGKVVDDVQRKLREAIYKAPRAHEDVPRIGEFAAIVRDHCRQQTGLIVHVVNEPHFVRCNCASCGQKVEEWMVECESGEWPKEGGPYFVPVKWLRRIQQLSIAASRAN